MGRSYIKWGSLELLLNLRSLHLFRTSFTLEVGLINGQSADVQGPIEVQRKPILSAALRAIPVKYLWWGRGFLTGITLTVHHPTTSEIQNLFVKCARSAGPLTGLPT